MCQNCQNIDLMAQQMEYLHRYLRDQLVLLDKSPGDEELASEIIRTRELIALLEAEEMRPGASHDLA